MTSSYASSAAARRLAHRLTTIPRIGVVDGLCVRRGTLPSSWPLPIASFSSSSRVPSWRGGCGGTHDVAVRFNSASTKANDVVELPPNLKFHPESKSSPFFDAEEVTAPAATSTADEAEALVDEDEKIEVGEGYDSEEDDEDSECRVLYDLSTKPDVPHAIPLPDRLRVPVLDLLTSEEVGTIHLSDLIFGCDPVRVDILHRVVVYQRNKKRGRRNAGARTKTIGEISGSGAKVRQQKGSGKARAGHSRPAHWRGGYKAHGPKGNAQNYETKLNKKVRRMGVRHTLSQKLLEGNLVVTSDLSTGTHKTKELQEALERFGVAGHNGATALLIDDAEEDKDGEASGGAVYGGLDVNLKVASGNLHKIKVLNQMGCNVYTMLRYEKLFLSLAAVRSLEERLEKFL